jgi:hypothetical protein
VELHHQCHTAAVQEAAVQEELEMLVMAVLQVVK